MNTNSRNHPKLNAEKILEMIRKTMICGANACRLMYMLLKLLKERRVRKKQMYLKN